MFVAGGIGHGEAIAAYLRMGASGCQMGTRFVCATESIAHPAFKQAFIRASARDAVPSVQIDPEFKVIPVRALANRASRRFVEAQLEVIARHRAGALSFEQAALAIEHFWAGALRRAVIEGDVENGSLMAGQSVGLIDKVQPLAEILDELVAQAVVAARARRGRPAARRGGGGMTLATPGRGGPPLLPVVERRGDELSAARRLLRRLVEVMATTVSPQERLDRIVRMIAADIVAEVCSAYVMRAGEYLELFATEGLQARAPSIRPGCGSARAWSG